MEAKPSKPRAPFGKARAWIDATAALGPGLSTSPWRYGGVVRGSVAIGSFFVTAAGSYALERSSPGGLSSTWMTPSAGAGVGFPLPDEIWVGARLEAFAERLDVSIEPNLGRADRAARWTFGARAGVEGAWMFSSFLGLVIGAEGSLRRTATDVRVGPDVAATARPIDFTFLGGLRVVPWRGAAPRR